ncbi:hypothetical protein B0H17DRAFT_1216916 [Mycena rosella]|uniref:Uncharacterized protein n=1 Tax=Mycena rosella TaxID=1033263 RepID=A0AAD7FUA0_MYCRO|nr:hypothetical protein B0H17DRAFT_1216916 [Mycena rosella]
MCIVRFLLLRSSHSSSRLPPFSLLEFRDLISVTLDPPATSPVLSFSSPALFTATLERKRSTQHLNINRSLQSTARHEKCELQCEAAAGALAACLCCVCTIGTDADPFAKGAMRVMHHSCEALPLPFSSRSLQRPRACRIPGRRLRRIANLNLMPHKEEVAEEEEGWTLSLALPDPDPETPMSPSFTSSCPFASPLAPRCLHILLPHLPHISPNPADDARDPHARRGSPAHRPLPHAHTPTAQPRPMRELALPARAVLQ